jgi:hypothetical protein
VTVYTISDIPRFIADRHFSYRTIAIDETIKSKRKQQQEKDCAMSCDSDESIVIWDGKSKGSYANILRAIEQQKECSVFLSNENRFLDKKEIFPAELECTYRKNTGYSAKEVLDCFPELGFKSSMSFYSFLQKKKLIKKIGKVYSPEENYTDLFLIDRYRGKPRGVRFTPNGISYIQEIVENNSMVQSELF